MAISHFCVGAFANPLRLGYHPNSERAHASHFRNHSRQPVIYVPHMEKHGTYDARALARCTSRADQGRRGTWFLHAQSVVSELSSELLRRAVILGGLSPFLSSLRPSLPLPCLCYTHIQKNIRAYSTSSLSSPCRACQRWSPLTRARWQTHCLPSCHRLPRRLLFISSTHFTESISASKYPRGYTAYRQYRSRVAMFVPFLTPVWGALLSLTGG
jgi:hypothetical protein